MPSRTAASMPGDDLRRVPVQPEVVVGDRQHLVVADVRPRRDTGARVSSGARAVVAGRDPGHVGGVLRVQRVEGAPRVLPLRRAGCEGARDDHLRVGEALVPLREAARHPVPARAEVRMDAVDAVVDDPDLHALAGAREPRAPERGRADEARSRRAQRVVADVRIDLRHAVDALEAVDLTLGEPNREPVEDGRVAPLHGQLGHGLRETRLDIALDRAQRPHVTAARKWRRIEREDHLDERSAGSRRSL